MFVAGSPTHYVRFLSSLIFANWVLRSWTPESKKVVFIYYFYEIILCPCCVYFIVKDISSENTYFVWLHPYQSWTEMDLGFSVVIHWLLHSESIAESADWGHVEFVLDDANLHNTKVSYFFYFLVSLWKSSEPFLYCWCQQPCLGIYCFVSFINLI